MENRGSDNMGIEPLDTRDYEDRTSADEGKVDESEFYAVSSESGNLVWSALSVIFAILSVVLFAFFYIGGIVCAIAAIVFAVVSSRKLRFFDKMALFGLIFGIFGLVFGVFSMIIDITGILDGMSL